MPNDRLTPRPQRRTAQWLSLAWLLAGSGLAASAAAAPCEEVSQSVVVTGSSAVKPLLAALGKLIEASNREDLSRMYYSGAGSCAGVDAILSPASFAPETLIYWDAGGAEVQCEVQPGDPIDQRIGVSDVFPSTCRDLPNGLPSNIADFQGPVQTMVFAVPNAAGETTISAEAAYYVFGFGSDSGVAPWTRNSRIFRRNELSGTQGLLAKAIGVPADRWRGIETGGTSEVIQQLLSSNPDNTRASIGILTANSADTNRVSLTTLAYQDFGSSCAVLPDTSRASTDKANVRTGDYPLWGPLHLLANVDSSRRPISEAATEVIHFITGTSTPIAGLDLIRLAAEQHIVPQCAMTVERAYELGPLAPHTPAQPCGCYFEALASGTNRCERCTRSQDCSGQGEICSLGYCEQVANSP